MMRRLIALVLGLFLLTGCAVSKDLRANPHEKGTIKVDLPYQTVLANITSSASTCFPERGTILDHYFTTSAEIEPGKLGRVEAVNGHSGGVNNAFVSLDVRSTSTGTEVDYFISYRFFGTYNDSSSFRPIALAWAAGDGSKCG